MILWILVAELSHRDIWTEQQYAKNFEPYKKVDDNVDRIHHKDFSPQEFIDKYEMPYKPVVICGLTDQWKAKSKWTLHVSYQVTEFFFIKIYSLPSRN